MARSSIRRRQEAERRRIETYCATLRRVSRASRRAPDFDEALAEVKHGFAGETIRDEASWRPKMKTRDPARLRLAAARHLFACYPVPPSLERIWLDAEGLEETEVMLRKRWYVVAARGGSLYRECASMLLARKEVHAFLNAPGDLGFEEAFWYAIARPLAADERIALAVVRSKIARTPRAALGFWRDAARFFCANPLPVAGIDDLCDFLAERRGRDRGYSLKGRTLASLRRAMHEWHRDLAAIGRIREAQRRAAVRMRRDGMLAYGLGSEAGELDAGRWPGSTLPDWHWRPPPREGLPKGADYAVRQLCTADELVEETRAMRHCVSSYARWCIAGNASIWSLRLRRNGKVERLLTIELDPRNRAVQVRGFANRLPTAGEYAILRRWAGERGIALA